ncbi:hypothetical protein YC2023_034032 [Brassica napus]
MQKYPKRLLKLQPAPCRGGDALGSLDSFVNRLLQYLGAKEGRSLLTPSNEDRRSANNHDCQQTLLCASRYKNITTSWDGEQILDQQQLYMCVCVCYKTQFCNYTCQKPLSNFPKGNNEAKPMYFARYKHVMKCAEGIRQVRSKSKDNKSSHIHLYFFFSKFLA